MLKDVGNELADRLGVERTPEVFVLDAGRVVRYRGRVDDQFGFGVHRPAPAHRDLAAALDDLLAGRPVATPRTEPAGCRVGRIAKAQGGCGRHVLEAGGPHPPRPLRRLPPRGRDRAVLAGDVPAGRRLGRDDRRGGAGGPHAPLARQPRVRLVRERGPPERRREADDRRLGRGRVAEGDPRDIPEPTRYVEGWRIPAPDLVIALPEEVKIPAEGTMPYQNFMVNPKLKKDVWVRASQVRPGTARSSITWSSSCCRPGAVMSQRSTF